MELQITGDPIADIEEPLRELPSSFDPTLVVDFGGWGLTQYTLWLLIIAVITIVVILVAGRKLTLRPEKGFASLVEYGYDAIRRNMGEGAIGHGYKKHMPFLATLFFFILICNFIGLIPGCKTPTGSLSITWALSICSFVYFNYWGVKAKGGLGYIKAIAPSGLPGPLVPVIWLFEFISLVLRALTLAVRLYGNMFAGHMVLGVFGILTSVFILNAIQFGATLALPAVAWVLFLFVMYALECLVAFLQAFVFTILSAVYISLATSEH